MQCSLVAGAMFAIGCLACGGGARQASTQPPASNPPPFVGIDLERAVADQVWYRATSICGQGPYEIEVPVTGARWGEEIELHLATPRRVALHAVIVADDAEVAKAAAVYDPGGRAGGKAENTRCVADLRERIAAGRVIPGTPSGPPVQPGIRVRPPGEPPPREVPVTAQLELEQGEPPPSIELLRHGWRRPERGEPRGRFARIRVRLWSIEPNDLEGVRFGVRRIEWRPNVSVADYEAYLARLVADDEAQRERAEEEMRRRIAEAEERQRRQPPPPPPKPAKPKRTVVVEIDAKAELERYRREEEARRRRAAEIAAEAERRRKRQEFCATHPEDRGCWGAGGRQMHDRFGQLKQESERYCAGNREDARCWSNDDRWRRERVWNKRVHVAIAPPKQPDGPPPAPLAETKPPKLSANAEWRNGYWHWTGATWVWLGGIWRVPEADIVAEKTTTAPEAPPPIRVEAPPPPPMTTTIWVAGFWQWNGSVWVWVPGSWQLRPDAGAAWRPAEWKTRGTVHVLIPGGWVRVRGGRR